MDLLEHNRLAWNQESRNGNVWTVPVKPEVLEAARRGEYTLLLTPTKPVPQAWLGEVRGKRILCLASAGGQQGPVLAAAGAQVTVFDNSDEQLKADEVLSKEHNLGIQTVRGNMQDLGCFEDACFDLVFHPVSNCFIDDILPVWVESHRVLKMGGSLLSGFTNPLMYMIDWELAERTGECKLKYAIPYSDLVSLPPEVQRQYRQDRTPFEFGHSLTDQIQGQISAGFVIAGFYEDKGEALFDPYTDSFIATLALKMS